MNRNQVLPQVELSTDPKALSRIDFCAPQSYQGAGFLEISALPRLAEEASSMQILQGLSRNKFWNWVLKVIFTWSARVVCRIVASIWRKRVDL
jgi:hypothetical protein